jgi:OPT family small oligopeptide transporter
MESCLCLLEITTINPDNSYVSDPIITPFFSNVNQAIGMFLVSFGIVLPVYYKNIWSTGYLPLNSPDVFDNTGNPYSVDGILNPDYTLNVTAYEAYSPPYLSAGYSVLYMFFFAAYTASIVHVALYNHRELADGFRTMLNWRGSVREEFNDVHNRLMQRYKECPEWWYLALLAVSFVLACVSSEIYHTGMPIWGIVLAIVFAFTLQVPIGIITAVTNSEITLNVVAELIGGYTLAGNPVANMLFKTYGYIATAQSVQFAADLKLGHYMKIPPRLTFWAQLFATVLCVFVSIGVNDWQIGNIQGICEVANPDGWSCPGKFSLSPLLYLFYLIWNWPSTNSVAANYILNRNIRVLHCFRSLGCSWP